MTLIGLVIIRTQNTILRTVLVSMAATVLRTRAIITRTQSHAQCFFSLFFQYLSRLVVLKSIKTRQLKPLPGMPLASPYRRKLRCSSRVSLPWSGSDAKTEGLKYFPEAPIFFTELTLNYSRIHDLRNIPSKKILGSPSSPRQKDLGQGSH